MNKHGLIRASVEKMRGYVPGEQPAAADWIKLNTNENPYPPSPCVLEALGAIQADALRRYPPPTSGPLRQCIARLYGFEEKQVFCGNGSDEILALCTRAFVGDGGKIGYFDPSYSLYPVLASISDCETVAVSLGEGFSWEDPPLDAGIDLFFLTNPNAPTGMLFPLERISAFCDVFDGVVLIDEAYVDFASGNALELVTRYPNVLVSRSLSKSYSLAGLRVGYVFGHADLIGALDKIKDSYNLDIVAQRLAVAALEDQPYMRACVQKIRMTRERLREDLARRGFGVYPSETNFLWCKPPSGLLAPDYVAGLRAGGILIRHFAVAGLSDFVRISIGLDSQMERLVMETDKILEGVA